MALNIGEVFGDKIPPPGFEREFFHRHPKGKCGQNQGDYDDRKRMSVSEMLNMEEKPVQDIFWTGGTFVLIFNFL